MKASGTPIIPGEVLIARENLVPREHREPIQLTTDAEAFATLPVSYIGFLTLDRITDWNEGVSMGVALAGSIAVGLATVSFLEKRGVIETL